MLENVYFPQNVPIIKLNGQSTCAFESFPLLVVDILVNFEAILANSHFCSLYFKVNKLFIRKVGYILGCDKLETRKELETY
jgi:hypothetical protein